MKHADQQEAAADHLPDSRLWVKVCGLTCADAVDAAVAAQADAIGFVFARSPRQVSASQAQRLAAQIPSTIARVAVMLHPTQAEVDEVCRYFKPDLLQTDAQDFIYLQLPASLPRLPVLRSGQVPASLPDRFLFEGRASGQGEVADWQAAAALRRMQQASPPVGGLVLAGGLNAGNVAAAIEAVRPSGVDVSSGVEARPGRKDPQKIHEFVRLARAARRGASR